MDGAFVKYLLVQPRKMPFLPRYFILILLLVLFAGVENAWAQKPAPKQKPVQKQQTATPPDTSQKEASPDRFLKDLEEYSHRKGVPARVVRSLFNFKKKTSTNPDTDPELIRNAYTKDNYKIVRSIEIRTLDPFGYSIDDSTKTPRSIVQRAGNSIHIKTQRGRIRNMLLFKKGKPLEPLALLESERLLRQTEFIIDAKIRVNEKTSTADSVDIIVATRDIFSIGGSVAYNEPKTFGIVAFRDLNILGLGHQFRNRLWFGIDYLPQSWQYVGSYFIQNIYRTYISSNLLYTNDYRVDQKGFLFNRIFYATNTKYAGGYGMNWFKKRTFVTDSSQDLHYNTKDFWLSRSYKLKSYELGAENPGRLIVGGRVINTSYTQRPEIGTYRNTTLYLGSVGYSYRSYYKDKYLFGFGRTEDVPTGNLFALTGGYEHAKGFIRQYMGAQASFGTYTPKFGYIYGGLAYGSFLHKGDWDQGAIAAELLYFTKLYNVHGWLIRNFIWNRMTYGLHRYPNEFVNINNLEGIRGFRPDSLQGQNKFVLNLECNVFTPLSFIGFKIAFVAFADIAWLSPTYKVWPFQEIPFQGYGIGLRIRNEYLAFNTIQLLLAYYPRVPEGQSTSNYRFYENSRPYYQFRDFYYSQPAVIPYR